MLSANNISKQYGPQTLFEKISFTLSPSEKVGLVGRNGSGKSTLFKLILGQVVLDSGDFFIPKNYKIGHLEQHISFSKQSVLEECCQFLPEEEKEFTSYKVEKILMGLGFSKEDFQKDPRHFSGGWQIRINLAKVLSQNPNLLLLDEPTNYLDIVSIEWLKVFLKNFKGELILITHDRQFMDGIVTHIMGLHRKQIKKIRGNTENYYNKIVEEEIQYEKNRVNLDKKRSELETFINRFKAKASKATLAQSKMKQLEKIGQLDKLKNEKNLQFQFNYSPCPGKILLTAKELSFSYDQSSKQPLIQNFSLIVKSNDRIAIVGKNGKGKTTLLNLLGGELRLDKGEIVTHPSIKMALFAQSNIQRLDEAKTIVEEINESNPSLTFQQTRNICGTVMFEGEMAHKKISVLSGGEKARVMLGKVLAFPSNILLLDEPTNHLDMESIQSLSNEIDDYPGALIVVTHNVELINSFATKLIIFANDKIEIFEGTYQDFLNKGGWEQYENILPLNNKEKESESKKILKSDLGTNEKKIANIELQNRIKELEKKILEHEELTKKIDQRLMDAYALNDTPAIAEFLPLSGKLKQKIDEFYSTLELLELELTEH